MERGRLAATEIWIVDRDPGCCASTLEPRPGRRILTAHWDEFFERHLATWRTPGSPAGRDLLVPVHTTPHLLARWLARALSASHSVERIEVATLPSTPHAARAADGGMTLSFAEWLCPMHCVEPHLCPATRQHRSWDVSRALVSYARHLREQELPGLAGPYLARCTHLVEGVGVVVLGDWMGAARRIAAAASGGQCRALIGTVSGCHGVAQVFSVRKRV
jgi:hypothetical protein